MYSSERFQALLSLRRAHHAGSRNKTKRWALVQDVSITAPAQLDSLFQRNTIQNHREGTTPTWMIKAPVNIMHYCYKSEEVPYEAAEVLHRSTLVNKWWAPKKHIMVLVEELQTLGACEPHVTMMFNGLTKNLNDGDTRAAVTMFSLLVCSQWWWLIIKLVRCIHLLSGFSHSQSQ